VLVAVLSTVLYVALVIAVWGFITLATGSDVVWESGVSPLAGPSMVAAASAVVVLSVLFSLRGFTGRPPVARAMIAGALVYLLAPAVGGIIVGLDRVDAAAALLFAAARATGPFVPAAAIVAVLLVLAVPPVLALGDRASR
jgi:hypothetical protein